MDSPSCCAKCWCMDFVVLYQDPAKGMARALNILSELLNTIETHKHIVAPMEDNPTAWEITIEDIIVDAFIDKPQDQICIIDMKVIKHIHKQLNFHFEENKPNHKIISTLNHLIDSRQNATTNRFKLHEEVQCLGLKHMHKCSCLSVPAIDEACDYKHIECGPISVSSQDDQKMRHMRRPPQTRCVFKNMDKLRDLLEKSTKNFSEQTDQCIINECEAVKRISVILDIYNELLTTKGFWENARISEIARLEKQYEYHQIHHDFLHLKRVHVDGNKEGTLLCNLFKSKHPDHELEGCKGFARHLRERSNDEKENELFVLPEKDCNTKKAAMQNDKDIVIQQEIDKIHCFFLHSTVHLNDETDHKEALDTINLIRANSLNRFGEQESKYDDDAKDNVNAREKYHEMVHKMGVFQWQSEHGFRAGQNRQLAHLQNHHKNVKEEAMNNPYHGLSVENWNQTLRKSKAFYGSPSAKRMRTPISGSYNDQLTAKYVEWNQRQEISLQEVVEFKLYTDFDKLQAELKKCFRWNTLVDVLANKGEENESCALVLNARENAHNEKEKLKERLRHFYFWRLGLIIGLHKFGQSVSASENRTLYHGVNGQMILQPTASLAFSGPLSTTSSLHVATSFSTDRGMILKIQSAFPRLGICNAFNASLLSDYPEEQEWLIGFMYVRILEVITITSASLNLNNPLQCLNDMNGVRSAFFAVHLFKQGVYSMSEHLEFYVCNFLQCALRMCHCEDCDSVEATYDNKETRGTVKRIFCKQISCVDSFDFDGYNSDKSEHGCGSLEHDDSGSVCSPHDHRLNDDIQELYKVLWNKFNEFRDGKKVLKIDKISDKLKPFFFCENGHLRFGRIAKIFKNVQEIHLFNNYICDQKALGNLEMKGKSDEFKNVSFLYYDYKGDIPDVVNEKLLKKFQNKKQSSIRVEYKKIASITGYKIKITKSKKIQNVKSKY